MDDKEKPTVVAATEDVPPADTEKPAPTQKTYKRPTITRHGNLRLMTQLE